MLTSGYLAASPPEKLNVTFCVIQQREWEILTTDGISEIVLGDF